MTDMNRREFFKYSIGSAFAVGTGTYSSESHAFAFTAAAIATGEKIGWAAKPPIDLSVDYISDYLLQFVLDMNSLNLRSLTKATEHTYQFDQEADRNDYSRRIQTLSASCNLDSLSEVGIKLSKQTEDVSHKLSYQKAMMKGYKDYAPVDLTLTKYLFSDETRKKPLSKNEASELKRFFQRLSYSQNTNAHTGKFAKDRIAAEARQLLNQSVINYHMSAQFNNKYLDVGEKVNNTYHSKEWRDALNGSSADISLLQEVIIQKATEVQLEFELLLLEQQTVVLECVSALNDLDNI